MKQVTRQAFYNAALLIAANAAIEMPYSEDVVHERITQANSSLFVEGHFSAPLTSYAVGFRDSDMVRETLDFVAPAVQTSRRFEYASFDSNEEFYFDEDDKRAIRGDYKNVEYTSEKVNEKTDDHGLSIIIDLDEVGDMPNWEQYYTAKLIRRLDRNSLRRAIALLDAASINTAVTWDASAGLDPDQDLIDLILDAGDESGIEPNRMLIGGRAHSRRLRAHRAQDGAGGFASAAFTMEQLADYLGLDTIRRSKERITLPDGSGKQQLVNDKVFSFNASNSADREDPSNIKRFVTGGRKVYSREIGPKTHQIAVSHYEKTAITSTLGLRSLTVSG